MMDFSRIMASAPVNAQAARSMSKGEHFTPSVDFNQAVHDVPPPMRPLPADPSLPDLTGTAYGRLRVIGLRANHEKQKRAMWVCRCVCGSFVERSTKAIKAQADGECPVCGYTRKMREGYLPGMKNNPKEPQA